MFLTSFFLFDERHVAQYAILMSVQVSTIDAFGFIPIIVSISFVTHSNQSAVAASSYHEDKLFMVLILCIYSSD